MTAGTTSADAIRARYPQVIARLQHARRVVVFTGAGVSAESGIPTFRDDGGLWQRFPPEQFASLGGLLRTAAANPRRFADFLLAVIEPVARARPNPAHRAIAQLQSHAEVAVVTQNVDGLHQEAGSRLVHEVHGSLLEVVRGHGEVLRRLWRHDLEYIAGALREVVERRSSGLTHLAVRRAVEPLLGITPRGLHRPNVVLFGEALKQPDWERAVLAAGRCDLMLVVGTAGLVYPAAELPEMARGNGAPVVEVDLAPRGTADADLAGPAGTLLPALLAAAF